MVVVQYDYRTLRMLWCSSRSSLSPLGRPSRKVQPQRLGGRQRRGLKRSASNFAADQLIMSYHACLERWNASVAPGSGCALPAPHITSAS